MFGYFLLTSILATGHSWILTSTHSTIIPQLTEDVILQCFYEGPNDDDCHEVEEITQIRLLKMDSKNAWNTVAEIVLPNTSQAELPGPDVPGLFAYGHLGHLNESFLSVTWSTTSEDTAGSYKCEVDCFVIDNRNDVHVTTGVVSLIQNNVTMKDLLDAIVQMRKKSTKLSQKLKSLRKEVSDQHQKHIFNTNSQVRNWSKIMAQEIDFLKEECLAEHQKLKADMKSQARNLSDIMSEEINTLKEELTNDVNRQARDSSILIFQEVNSLKEESLAEYKKIKADMKSQARNVSTIMSEEITSLKEELATEMNGQAKNWSNIMYDEINFLAEENLARHQKLIADMEIQAINMSEIMNEEINSLKKELAADINQHVKNWSNIISDEIEYLKEESLAEFLNLKADMESQGTIWSKIMSEEVNINKEEFTTYVDSQIRNWSRIMSQELNSFQEKSLAEHVKLRAGIKNQATNWQNSTSSEFNLLKEELRTEVNNQARNWSNIMSQEISSIKKENLAEYQNLEEDLKSKSRNLSERISQEIVSLKTKSLAQYQNLTASIKSQVHSDIVKNYFELRNWPAGHYALLKTNDGCPDTISSKFENGYSQFQTYTSTRPQHTFTSASNLSRDMFNRYYGGRNVLRFELCVSSIKEPRVSWPVGTYCISYKQDDCPIGFNYGYSYFYPETSSSIIGKNFYDSTYYDDNYVGINYCCRNDGSPHTPVLLPNLKPFYLYRYRGICQNVQGMEVHEQSYVLDTNEGLASYVSHTYSPDSGTNPYTAYLCYYYKKQDGTV